MLGGVNFVLHAAGWLEGGLTMGYEKFVLDLDQCGMMHAFASGVDLSPNGQALEPIIENGPGQHFLGTAHTLANFETAFYRSSVADNNSFEQWEIEGQKRIEERANALCRTWLESYEAPYLDPAIDDALKDYVAKRKESMPDAFT
jgi:trimethylamine--corrinoid protein Co-methyltransferase